MKESKRRICHFPNCKKETYSDRAIFCGDHGRKIRSMETRVPTLALVGVSIAAKRLSKKM